MNKYLLFTLFSFFLFTSSLIAIGPKEAIEDEPPLIIARSAEYQPPLFKLEFLNGWGSLTQQGKAQQLNECTDLLKKVLTKSSSAGTRKNLLLYGAQKGYMACINILAVDSINEKKIEEAFYWYMLSYYSSLLKGTAPESARKGLEKVASNDICPPPLKFCITDFIQSSLLLENELEAFQDLDNQPKHKYQANFIARATKLARKTMDSLGNIDSKVRMAYYEGIGNLTENSDICYALGHILLNEGTNYNYHPFIHTAATLFRKANTPLARAELAHLIMRGKIDTDERLRPIDPSKRLDVAAKILDSINNYTSLVYMEELVNDFKYRKGRNGKSLETEKAVLDERISLLCQALNAVKMEGKEPEKVIPYALATYAHFILEGSTDRDENNMRFSDKARFEI